MMPSLSIVVPLYNKAPYVRLTLQALIEQLHETDEILVIDDQSTDNGPEIARALFNAAPGAGRVITLPENSGPATARNAGARLARASHLLFFDADDYPSSSLLQVLRVAIEQHPSAAVFAYQIAFQARGETQFAADKPIGVSTSIRPQHAFALDSLNGKVLCTASSTCVKREVFLLADGGFQEGLRYCEDPELWARLSASNSIIEIHETLAVYRDVEVSLSHSLRGRIGSANPYVATLHKLAKEYGDDYLQLARSILAKNLVFSRASGASRLDASRQLSQYKRTLGEWKYIFLRCINLLPASIFRKALVLRTILTIRLNSGKMHA